jgi:Fe-S-cluster containining protein
MEYRGIRVVGENIERNELFYSINITCEQLGSDNECKVHGDYEKKPLLCHRYPMEPDDTEKCSYQFQPITLHMG